MYGLPLAWEMNARASEFETDRIIRKLEFLLIDYPEVDIATVALSLIDEKSDDYFEFEQFDLDRIKRFVEENK